MIGGGLDDVRMLRCTVGLRGIDAVVGEGLKEKRFSSEDRQAKLKDPEMEWRPRQSR